jgi:hypothetical protein
MTTRKNNQKRSTRKPKSMSLVDQAKQLDKVKQTEAAEREVESATSSKEGFSLGYKSSDLIEIISVDRSIRTVKDAIAKAEIDMDLWTIKSQTINSWEVAGKINPGQDPTGKWRGEKLWKQTLWQVKITLERKAPKFVQDGIQNLVDKFNANAFKLPKIHRPKKQQPIILEIALMDAHFGKRCWAAETGADFDLDIIKHDFLTAVDELLEKASVYKVGEIIFPIGNDFFNQNSWLPMTEKGTFVDSVDTRFTLVYETGVEAVAYALARCREVANTTCMWVPGNHDPATSYYLCSSLRGMFKGTKGINVDISAKERKYIHRGNVLLGYTHGQEEKPAELPLLMAQEMPEAWGKSKFRAWRIGHFHKKKETKFISGDTFNGVPVTVLPSLSGTDLWHYRKGYIGNYRMAEAHLWDRTAGQIGYFSVLAQTERERLGISPGDAA